VSTTTRLSIVLIGLAALVTIGGVVVKAKQAAEQRAATRARLARAAAEKDAYVAGARGALDAVRDLQSLVRSGITYPEYTRRVGDARIAVDRFMRCQSRDLAPPSREKIEQAIGCYELAAGDWAKSLDPEWAYSADIHRQMMQELWRTADRHIAAADSALSLRVPTAVHD